MDTETKNRPVRKAAAVIGFVALLVLIAWLSITLVRNVPGSFASLASLAESVRSFDAMQVDSTSDDEAATQTDNATGTQDMLIVTSDTNVIENNGSVRLSWSDASSPGTFVFAYECTDGVAMSIVEEGGVRDLNCDTNYNLGNVNNVTLAISSERERFVDIGYTLGFIESDQAAPSVEAEAVITVVNEEMPVIFTAATDAEENESAPTEAPETPTVDTEEVPEEPVGEIFVPSTAIEESGVEYTQEFTYTIPVSDPNGRTDLAARFLGTGRIINSTFVPGTINGDAGGAIQFEVKNLGTKTSEEWTYSVSLPSSGPISSPAQAPLKPNERAVITIGFPATDRSTYDFIVDIETDVDSARLNNQFIETVFFN